MTKEGKKFYYGQGIEYNISSKVRRKNMNAIWVTIMIVTMSLLLCQNPAVAFDSIFNGSTKAIELGLKLWAIYAVWLGILKIIEDTGLTKIIAKKSKKLIHFLFGTVSNEAEEQIAINITSNLLGMGNACTPSGIQGMFYLDKKSKYITSQMIMLLVLNVTSLQLFPTTVIGLRVAAGSSNPNSIIFPTLIATTASTVVGIILCKICSKLFRKREPK